MATLEELEESIKTLKQLNDQVTTQSIVIEPNLSQMISNILFDANFLEPGATNQSTIEVVFNDTNECLAKLQGLLQTHKDSLLQESNKFKTNLADVLVATEALVPSSKPHAETSEPSSKQQEPHESMQMPSTEEEALNIIGVLKGASKGGIKKQYTKLALKYHPDKGGDEENFKAINAAYALLMGTFEQENIDDTSPIVPLTKSTADFCKAAQLALKRGHRH